MKRIKERLFFGSDTIASAAIAALVLCFVMGCTCGKSLDLANRAKVSDNSSSNSSTDSSTTNSGDTPSDSVVEGLVKATTEDFADGVEASDFDALRSGASVDFQESYSADEIRNAFKSYIDKKRVVLPILRKVDSADVNFSRAPSIRTEKGLSILMAAGEFKTKPYKVRFDYEYVMRGGEWKLLKLVINIP